MSTTPGIPTSPPLAARRWPGKRVLFRAAAVLLGLLPLLAAEAVCHVGGWGRVTEIDDPFVGFTTVHPLFELDATGEHYEIARSRHAYFRPDSFAARKAANEYRVFCLGGSTVQGRPYAIETAFTTWLELDLRAADPTREWRVVNCGGVSYASYRLAPIMEELLNYEPDLFIVYTGHNEFLEARAYEGVKQTAPLVSNLHAAASHSRLYNVARAAWLDVSGDADRRALAERRVNLPDEVDALLDYRGGLADYHRDDAWRQGVVDHYEFNLRRMVRLARDAGVPIILVDPVSNLKDCPPFKFEGDLSSTSAAERFESLWEEAKATREPKQRVELLEQAVAIDPRHAGAQFLLGRAYYEQGWIDDARAAFLRAKEEDLCPLRMIEPLHERLALVARTTGAPLVDARRMYEQASPQGIVGNEMLVDHIHPSITGHQMLADLLFDQLVELDVVAPGSDWATRREELFRQHLAKLDAVYYAQGQQRLEGLIRWTQGRSGRFKPPGKE